jgi:hypothetical protein
MVREHFYLKEVMEIYFAEYDEVQIVLQKINHVPGMFIIP